MVTLTREPNDLTLEQIGAVANGEGKVGLGDDARAWLAKMRTAAEAAIAAEPDRPIYGFNRGFGSNARYPVGHEFKGKKNEKGLRERALRDLQSNLIVSHAANVGPTAPREVVRATMLLRAKSLARGRSTVRPDVVDKLTELLNAEITPAVPRFGSVSASGDLSPLSHIAAVLMGKGRVLLDERGRKAFGAETIDTQTYLKDADQHDLPKFAPLVLEMKEGLALNNGCQWSTAWGVLTALRMKQLVHTASLATALGVQAMLGSGRPFGAKFHTLRPHRGSQDVASWILELLQGYQFRDVTADEMADFDGSIQDPYNLRCAAQVLGPCLDLIARAEATLACEANSVTDNPVDLNEDASKYALEEIISGGHFHGMPVAVDVYGLLQAAGIMARLSNMRCVRYVDSTRNKGLGPQVRGSDPKATESGLLIAEYSTAGLCNHIWGLAMPTHLMSMSTDSGQEDHVSMAANVAMRAYEAAERLAEILAIELAFASQALALRAETKAVESRALDPEFGSKAEPETQSWQGPDAKRRGLEGTARTISFEKKWSTPLKEGAYEPGPLTKGSVAAIRDVFKRVGEDRELSWDIMRLAEKVLSGEIVQASGCGFKRH
jgi:histidine ammonia-lyase